MLVTLRVGQKLPLFSAANSYRYDESSNPSKAFKLFLWLLPFSGWQVIYVVEMSERMSCKSHFSSLLTFTEMVFLGRVSRENDELYDDHDVLHDEFLDEQDEHDV